VVVVVADGWLTDGGQFVADSQSILFFLVLVNLVDLGGARWDNCHPVLLLRATYSKVADSEKCHVVKTHICQWQRIHIRINSRRLWE
jgi:hypothetical protein